jgi:hypothetical protein
MSKTRSRKAIQPIREVSAGICFIAAFAGSAPYRSVVGFGQQQ